MTIPSDEIISMACEAGLGQHLPAENGLPPTWVGPDLAVLERFAEMVAAFARCTPGVFRIATDALEHERSRGYREGVRAEREACLKACKELLAVSERSAKDGDHFEIGRENAHMECIEAISARSQP